MKSSRSRLAAFLGAMGLAVSASPAPRHAIDHVGLGCADLEAGIAFVAARTGVVAAKGGVHPGRGTQNALMDLGGGAYLEIIAPVPGEPPAPYGPDLRKLDRPRPVFFALRSSDLEGTVRLLNANGFATDAIRPGSRKTPGCSTLTWRTVGLKDAGLEAAPFFIEWGKDVAHPSATSPGGCRLAKLEVFDPAPEALRKLFTAVGVEVPAAAGERGLRLTADCPKGAVVFGP